MSKDQQKLVSKILEASKKLNEVSRRGSADFVILPQSIINMLNKSKADIRKDKIKKNTKDIK